MWPSITRMNLYECQLVREVEARIGLHNHPKRWGAVTDYREVHDLRNLRASIVGLRRC